MKKEQYFCRDCAKEIKIDEDKNLIGGKLLKFEISTEDAQKHKKEIFIIKCDECFKKDPSLTNYQECEVYDRIVGYLRPVQQWNIGKQEEYKERKKYIMKDGSSDD